MLWNRRLGDIPGNNEAWEEEQRATILASPVAWGQLELGEEGESILDRGSRGVGLWQRGLCLRESVSDLLTRPSVLDLESNKTHVPWAGPGSTCQLWIAAMT